MPPVHAEVILLCSTTRPQGAESEKKKKMFGKQMFEGLDGRIEHLIWFLQTARLICAIHKTSRQTKLNTDVGIFLGKYTQQSTT